MELKAMVLFDGGCNLCNWAVGKVHNADKHHRFGFLPIQTALEQGLVSADKIDLVTGDEVALLFGGKLYFGHAALYRIMRLLGGGYKVLGALWGILPNAVKVWLYRAVAKRRHWFGRHRNYC